MVYGAKEILADSLLMFLEDAGLPHAYAISDVVANYCNESELAGLVSDLGACNRDDSGSPFFNAGREEEFPTVSDGTEGARSKDLERKERQKEILLPLVDSALDMHQNRLIRDELRDITCHYYSMHDDARQEQSHDIRMIKIAGGKTYQRVPWNPHTGKSSFLALCPVSVFNALEKKALQNYSPLCLVEQNIDPAPEFTTAAIDDSDIFAPVIDMSPSTASWHYSEMRRRATSDEDNEILGPASTTKTSNVPAGNRARFPVIATPQNLFLIPNYSPLAPRPPSLLYHHSSAGPDPAEGKNTHQVFDLFEDQSPPESLMMEREEDDK